MKKYVVLGFFLSFFFCMQAAFASNAELAQSSTINDILARKELRVGFDPGYMPFEMTDKNGNYVGFDIDLGNELAKAMGVKMVPVNIEFDGILPALLTGKIDVIMSAMTVTQERNLKIGFTDPYLMTGQSILVNKKHEGKITSWKDLNDQKYLVITRIGTTSVEATKRYMPNAQTKSFDKEVDGALEVANNRGDAFVYDMPFNVVFLAEQGKNSLFHLAEPFTHEPLAIGIRQGDPDFMNFLNNFLRQVRTDGRYDRLYNKWISSTDWFEQTQR